MLLLDKVAHAKQSICLKISGPTAKIVGIMGAYPNPKNSSSASQQNTMHGLTLAAERHKMTQLQSQMQEIQNQFAELQKEHEKLNKEHQSLNKKKQLDDDHHKETRQELDKMKGLYDPATAVEQKNIRKDTMKRARTARSTVKKESSARGKTKASTNKPAGTKSPRPRKAS